MKTEKTGIVLILLTVLAMCGSGFGAMQRYQLIDLGTLGGTAAYATSVNDNGQVAGWSTYDLYGIRHAFIWDSTNGMTDLGTLGGDRSMASAINNSGQVTGRSRNASGDNRAFIWDSTNGMQDIGTLGGSGAWADGINNSGQVTGGSGDSSGIWHGFVWDSTNGMQEIGDRGGQSINDNGEVAGGGAAFIWDSTNGMRDLGILPGYESSTAFGINNNGQVVGECHESADYRPFIWDSTNGMVGLSMPEGSALFAYSINDNGQAVGGGWDSSDRWYAFIWDSTNGIVDLNTLVESENEWLIMEAFDISNTGHIVGYGQKQDGGEVHAFMMTPATIRHVDGTTGSNSNDGLTRQTAFETIQFAIDNATPLDYDTILVWPGVYNETATNGINFKGKAITVKSAADAAVLEVPGFAAVTFAQGEDANSVLSNFVIRGSTTGIFAFFTSPITNPTINNVTVVDNDNGVIADNADLNITNSIFWNNTNGDLFGSPDPVTAQHSWFEDEQADPNMLAYWKMDETSDTTASDSAGSNDGTLYGDCIWQPAGGHIDGALQFNGSQDYVDVPDFDLSGSWTVALWVKCNLQTPGDPTGAMVFGNRDDGDNFFYMADGLRVRFRNNSVAYVSWTADTAFYNTWRHVGLVSNGTAVELYLDGLSQGSQTIDPTFKLYHIGDGWTNALYDFNGRLDDVRIYNMAVSAEEIEAMYRTGLYSDPLFVDPNSGDYHLLSQRGRYRATTDEWLLDDVTSSCVDGGDPDLEPTEERMPNGGRVNMGAYGNTATASMSEWPVKSDLDYDGAVNLADLAYFAREWLEKEEWKN